MSSSVGPLAVNQEQLWFLSRYSNHPSLYNEGVTIHIDAILNRDALCAAVAHLADRHDALRLSFHTDDHSQPFQRVNELPPTEVVFQDLSQLSAPAAEAEIARITLAQLVAPYDLSAPPLFRFTLVTLSPERHLLLMAGHHLIYDGPALNLIVAPDLLALYLALRDGTALPEIQEGSYLDFARWQRAWMQSPEARRRLGWWQQRLLDAPTMDLPLDRPRPQTQRYVGSRIPFDIPARQAVSLRSIAKGQGCSLFDAISTTVALALAVACGEDDVVFGTVADIRSGSGFRHLAGYTVTPFALRTDLSDDPDFPTALARVSAGLREAGSNLVPFERVVRSLGLPRDPTMNPVFQTMVTMLPPPVPLGHGWRIENLYRTEELNDNRARFDLHLDLERLADGAVSGRLGYNVDIFDVTAVQRLRDLWLAVVDTVVADPSGSLSSLRRTLIQPAVLAETALPPAEDLLARVDAVVKARPDDIAVGTMTYAELDTAASALTCSLGELGVGPGDVVALSLGRSPQVLVAMLAVARAGASYLPLDPDYPADRTAFMVRDAGVRVTVTDAGLTVNAEVPGTKLPWDDVLYVLYTSGSTGRPKGVAVRRPAVSRLIDCFAAVPGLGPDDVALAHTTVAFDISVIELWLPLAMGSRIVLADRDEARDGRELRRLVESEGVTFLQATPATWQLLLAAGWEGGSAVTALCGGERLTPELAAAVLPRVGRLWNVYGPTETTVWSTLAQVTDPADITIGRPIPGTTVSVVGEDLSPRPQGTRGELLIGGDGLMAGYLNRPDLNQSRLVEDPVRPGARAYRTGDLVRIGGDGQLRHLGRTDDQIKIRGFRVEPGEVESVLLRHPAVAEAVVIAREDRAGDVRLVAYVVPSGAAVDPDEIAGRARMLLPPYMVPSQFVVLTAIPRTANGKVDRRALPRVEAAVTQSEPPRPGLETDLARLWAQALGLSSVGRHDDFFALGGHSLLAASLVMKVERLAGRPVPMQMLLSGGASVAGMAALLRSAATPDSQTGAATLYVVYPSEESLLSMRSLSRELPVAMAGLLAPRVRGRFDLGVPVDQMARTLVADLRARQPRGPYLLAGYSFAGLIAYEMAALLHAAGETIQWLGLLDTFTPEVARNLHATHYRVTTRERITRIINAGPRELVKDIGMRVRALPAPPGMFDWYGAMKLSAGHDCTPHDVPLDVFVPVLGDTEDGGWSALHAGPVQIHRVPGDHLSMVVHPQAATLAAVMSASLSSALAMTGS